MNESPLSDDEFRDALPGYLNGTLDAPLRERVERHLRADAAAARELARHRAVREAVRRHADGIPADLGWEGYARQHGLDCAGSDTSARPPTIPRRRPPWMTIGAAAMILGQAAVIGALWMGRESRDEGFSSMRSGAAARTHAPTLQVRFKPEATELEVRKLLMSVDGRIVDGPNQFGDYLVHVPAQQIEAARSMLGANPWVLSATVRP